ncbi:uncharacterized protein LOC104266378 [Ciona intestinalis]
MTSGTCDDYEVRLECCSCGCDNVTCTNPMCDRHETRTLVTAANGVDVCCDVYNCTCAGCWAEEFKAPGSKWTAGCYEYTCLSDNAGCYNIQKSKLPCSDDVTCPYFAKKEPSLAPGACCETYSCGESKCKPEYSSGHILNCTYPNKQNTTVLTDGTTECVKHDCVCPDRATMNETCVAPATCTASGCHREDTEDCDCLLTSECVCNPADCPVPKTCPKCETRQLVPPLTTPDNCALDRCCETADCKPVVCNTTTVTCEPWEKKENFTTNNGCCTQETCVCDVTKEHLCPGAKQECPYFGKLVKSKTVFGSDMEPDECCGGYECECLPEYDPSNILTCSAPEVQDTTKLTNGTLECSNHKCICPGHEEMNETCVERANCSASGCHRNETENCDCVISSECVCNPADCPAPKTCPKCETRQLVPPLTTPDNCALDRCCETADCKPVECNETTADCKLWESKYVVDSEACCTEYGCRCDKCVDDSNNVQSIGNVWDDPTNPECVTKTCIKGNATDECPLVQIFNDKTKDCIPSNRDCDDYKSSVEDTADPCCLQHKCVCNTTLCPADPVCVHPSELVSDPEANNECCEVKKCSPVCVYKGLRFKKGETWDHPRDDCLSSMCSCNYNKCDIVDVSRYECPAAPMTTCATGQQPTRVRNTDNKCCFRYECPCLCAVFGDPHYVTFDGGQYTFMGECHYTLAKYRDSDKLHIYSDNTVCVRTSDFVGTCLKKLFVKWESTLVQISYVESYNYAQAVEINGTTLTSLPWSKGGIIVRYEFRSIVVTIPEISLWIKYLLIKMPSVFIKVSPTLMFNKTVGLCGTCTNQRLDDYEGNNGTMIGGSTEFGYDWEVDVPDEECKRCDAEKNPACYTCDDKIYEDNLMPLPEWCKNCTEAHCQALVAPTFAECNKIHPPSAFVKSCEYDASALSKCDICNSAVAESYATLCLGSGVCVDWRKDNNCSMECNGDLVYKSCVNKCTAMQTCDNYLDECESEELESGCFCPDGLILDASNPTKCNVPDCCSCPADPVCEPNEELRNATTPPEPCCPKKECVCKEPAEPECITPKVLLHTNDTKCPQPYCGCPEDMAYCVNATANCTTHLGCREKSLEQDICGCVLKSQCVCNSELCPAAPECGDCMELTTLDTVVTGNVCEDCCQKYQCKREPCENRWENATIPGGCELVLIDNSTKCCSQYNLRCDNCINENGTYHKTGSNWYEVKENCRVKYICSEAVNVIGTPYHIKVVEHDPRDHCTSKEEYESDNCNNDDEYHVAVEVPSSDPCCSNHTCQCTCPDDYKPPPDKDTLKPYEELDVEDKCCANWTIKCEACLLQNGSSVAVGKSIQVDDGSGCEVTKYCSSKKINGNESACYEMEVSFDPRNYCTGKDQYETANCKKNDENHVAVEVNSSNPCCSNHTCQCSCPDDYKPPPDKDTLKPYEELDVEDKCCAKWTINCKACLLQNGSSVGVGDSIQVDVGSGCVVDKYCSDKKTNGNESACYQMEVAFDPREKCQPKAEFESTVCGEYHHAVEVVYSGDTIDPDPCCSEFECVCNNRTMLSKQCPKWFNYTCPDPRMIAQQTNTIDDKQCCPEFKCVCPQCPNVTECQRKSWSPKVIDDSTYPVECGCLSTECECNPEYCSVFFPQPQCNEPHYNRTVVNATYYEECCPRVECTCVQANCANITYEGPSSCSPFEDLIELNQPAIECCTKHTACRCKNESQLNELCMSSNATIPAGFVYAPILNNSTMRPNCCHYVCDTCKAKDGSIKKRGETWIEDDSGCGVRYLCTDKKEEYGDRCFIPEVNRNPRDYCTGKDQYETANCNNDDENHVAVEVPSSDPCCSNHTCQCTCPVDYVPPPDKDTLKPYEELDVEDKCCAKWTIKCEVCLLQNGSSVAFGDSIQVDDGSGCEVTKYCSSKKINGNESACYEMEVSYDPRNYCTGKDQYETANCKKNDENHVAVEVPSSDPCCSNHTCQCSCPDDYKPPPDKDTLKPYEELDVEDKCCANWTIKCEACLLQNGSSVAVGKSIQVDDGSGCEVTKYCSSKKINGNESACYEMEVSFDPRNYCTGKDQYEVANCKKNDENHVAVEVNSSNPCCSNHTCQCTCPDDYVPPPDKDTLKPYEELEVEDKCCAKWTINCKACLLQNGSSVGVGDSIQVDVGSGCVVDKYCSDKKTNGNESACYQMEVAFDPREKCQPKAEFESTVCGEYHHAVEVVYSGDTIDPDPCCSEFECVCNNRTMLSKQCPKWFNYTCPDPRMIAQQTNTIDDKQCCPEFKCVCPQCPNVTECQRKSWSPKVIDDSTYPAKCGCLSTECECNPEYCSVFFPQPQCNEPHYNRTVVNATYYEECCPRVECTCVQANCANITYEGPSSCSPFEDLIELNQPAIECCTKHTACRCKNESQLNELCMSSNATIPAGFVYAPILNNSTMRPNCCNYVCDTCKAKDGSIKQRGETWDEDDSGCQVRYLCTDKKEEYGDRCFISEVNRNPRDYCTSKVKYESENCNNDDEYHVAVEVPSSDPCCSNHTCQCSCPDDYKPPPDKDSLKPYQELEVEDKCCANWTIVCKACLLQNGSSVAVGDSIQVDVGGGCEVTEYCSSKKINGNESACHEMEVKNDPRDYCTSKDQYESENCNNDDEYHVAVDVNSSDPCCSNHTCQCNCPDDYKPPPDKDTLEPYQELEVEDKCCANWTIVCKACLLKNGSSVAVGDSIHVDDGSGCEVTKYCSSKKINGNESACHEMEVTYDPRDYCTSKDQYESDNCNNVDEYHVAVEVPSSDPCCSNHTCQCSCPDDYVPPPDKDTLKPYEELDVEDKCCANWTIKCEACLLQNGSSVAVGKSIQVDDGSGCEVTKYCSSKKINGNESACYEMEVSFDPRNYCTGKDQYEVANCKKNDENHVAVEVNSSNPCCSNHTCQCTCPDDYVPPPDKDTLKPYEELYVEDKCCANWTINCKACLLQNGSSVAVGDSIQVDVGGGCELTEYCSSKKINGNESACHEMEVKNDPRDYCTSKDQYESENCKNDDEYHVAVEVPSSDPCCSNHTCQCSCPDDYVPPPDKDTLEPYQELEVEDKCCANWTIVCKACLLQNGSSVAVGDSIHVDVGSGCVVDKYCSDKKINGNESACYQMEVAFDPREKCQPKAEFDAQFCGEYHHAVEVVYSGDTIDPEPCCSEFECVCNNRTMLSKQCPKWFNYTCPDPRMIAQQTNTIDDKQCCPEFKCVCPQCPNVTECQRKSWSPKVIDDSTYPAKCGCLSTECECNPEYCSVFFPQPQCNEPHYNRTVVNATYYEECCPRVECTCVQANCANITYEGPSSCSPFEDLIELNQPAIECCTKHTACRCKNEIQLNELCMSSNATIPAGFVYAPILNNSTMRPNCCHYVCDTCKAKDGSIKKRGETWLEDDSGCGVRYLCTDKKEEYGDRCFIPEVNRNPRDYCTSKDQYESENCNNYDEYHVAVEVNSSDPCCSNHTCQCTCPDDYVPPPDKDSLKPYEELEVEEGCCANWTIKCKGCVHKDGNWTKVGDSNQVDVGGGCVVTEYCSSKKINRNESACHEMEISNDPRKNCVSIDQFQKDNCASDEVAQETDSPDPCCKSYRCVCADPPPGYKKPPSLCSYPREVKVTFPNSTDCFKYGACLCDNNTETVFECFDYYTAKFTCTAEDRHIVEVIRPKEEVTDFNKCCPKFECPCKECNTTANVTCPDGFIMEDQRMPNDCCAKNVCVCNSCETSEGALHDFYSTWVETNSEGCALQYGCYPNSDTNERGCRIPKAINDTCPAPTTCSSYETRVPVVYNETQLDPNLCCPEYKCECNSCGPDYVPAPNQDELKCEYLMPYNETENLNQKCCPLYHRKCLPCGTLADFDIQYCDPMYEHAVPLPHPNDTCCCPAFECVCNSPDVIDSICDIKDINAATCAQLGRMNITYSVVNDTFGCCQEPSCECYTGDELKIECDKNTTTCEYGMEEQPINSGDQCCQKFQCKCSTCPSSYNQTKPAEDNSYEEWREETLDENPLQKCCPRWRKLCTGNHTDCSSIDCDADKYPVQEGMKDCCPVMKCTCKDAEELVCPELQSCKNGETPKEYFEPDVCCPKVNCSCGPCGQNYTKYPPGTLEPYEEYELVTPENVCCPTYVKKCGNISLCEVPDCAANTTAVTIGGLMDPATDSCCPLYKCRCDVCHTEFGLSKVGDTWKKDIGGGCMVTYECTKHRLGNTTSIMDLEKCHKYEVKLDPSKQCKSELYHDTYVCNSYQTAHEVFEIPDPDTCCSEYMCICKEEMQLKMACSNFTKEVCGEHMQSIEQGTISGTTDCCPDHACVCNNDTMLRKDCDQWTDYTCNKPGYERIQTNTVDKTNGPCCPTYTCQCKPEEKLRQECVMWNHTCPVGERKERNNTDCCPTYECVCDKCVMDEGIYPVNVSWVSPDDICTKQTCVLDPTTGCPAINPSDKYDCPYVDTDDCIKKGGSILGNESTSGCCKICNPITTPCERTIQRETINATVDGHLCWTATKQDIAFCSGSCQTSQSYDEHTGEPNGICRCCKSARSSKRTYSLFCDDGINRDHQHIEIMSCGCEETACEAPTTVASIIT